MGMSSHRREWSRRGGLPSAASAGAAGAVPRVAGARAARGGAGFAAGGGVRPVGGRGPGAGAVSGLAYKAPIPRLVSVKAPDRYELVEGEPLARTADAIAVRRGDADALNLVNGWIEARKRDGFLAATGRYWLGTLDWMERLKPKAAAKK